ncbi:hypothetical protein Dimus_012898 [Dionaea muscipula]
MSSRELTRSVVRVAAWSLSCPSPPPHVVAYCPQLSLPAWGSRRSTGWPVLAAPRSPRRAAACCPPGSLVARLLAWRRGADRCMKLPLLAGCATLLPGILAVRREELAAWPFV